MYVTVDTCSRKRPGVGSFPRGPVIQVKGNSRDDFQGRSTNLRVWSASCRQETPPSEQRLGTTANPWEVQTRSIDQRHISNIILESRFLPPFANPFVFGADRPIDAVILSARCARLNDDKVATLHPAFVGSMSSCSLKVDARELLSSRTLECTIISDVYGLNPRATWVAQESSSDFAQSRHGRKVTKARKQPQTRFTIPILEMMATDFFEKQENLP